MKKRERKRLRRMIRKAVKDAFVEVAPSSWFRPLEEERSITWPATVDWGTSSTIGLSWCEGCRSWHSADFKGCTFTGTPT